jgi:hypothetical protein
METGEEQENVAEATNMASPPRVKGEDMVQS